MTCKTRKLQLKYEIKYVVRLIADEI